LKQIPNECAGFQGSGESIDKFAGPVYSHFFRRSRSTECTASADSSPTALDLPRRSAAFARILSASSCEFRAKHVARSWPGARLARDNLLLPYHLADSRLPLSLAASHVLAVRSADARSFASYEMNKKRRNLFE